MNKFKFYILFALVFFNGMSAFAKCDRACKSEKNRQAALAYCQKLGVECKVDNKRNCGSGWKDIKKFDDGGDSYFACIKTEKQEATEQNKKDAEQYCKQVTASGDYCEVKNGNCGSGLKELKEFNGKGEKYKACGKTKKAEGTEQNKKDAEEYCKQFSANGEYCVVQEGRCGNGLSKLKEFGGAGRNYCSCTKSARADASEANEKEAQEFCSKVNTGAGSVLFCDVQKRNCSGGFEKIKEIKGKGVNYAICLKAK
jgi:hypothetical protein